MDTEQAPSRQADFRRRGLAAGGVLLVAAAACAAAALGLLWARRFSWARALAILVVTLILLGWGLAPYPYLVVPDLTIHNTRAAPATLRVLSWILAAGVVLRFPSFGYLYWVFKGQDQRQTSGASGGEIRARERQ